MIRLCAVSALGALTMTACSDDDDTPAAPEKEMLVTKMEQKVKYVLEGYENFFAGAKNDITEMKYDGQGRLYEWVDNGKSTKVKAYTPTRKVKSFLQTIQTVVPLNFN